MSLRSLGQGGTCPFMSGLRREGTGHINDTLALWGSSLLAWLPSTCGSLIPSMSVGRWISRSWGSEKPMALAWWGVGLLAALEDVRAGTGQTC